MEVVTKVEKVDNHHQLVQRRGRGWRSQVRRIALICVFFGLLSGGPGEHQDLVCDDVDGTPGSVSSDGGVDDGGGRVDRRGIGSGARHGGRS